MPSQGLLSMETISKFFLSMEIDHKDSTFCDYLWPEIFKRLPSKDLCRCKCVSKSWKSLISSTWMINLYHSFSCSTKTTNLKPCLLFLGEGEEVVKYDAYPFCLLRPQKTTAEHVQLDVVHFPFQFPTVDMYWNLAKLASFNVVDVVEGVICISYTLESFFDSTILWNPSIHKYVSLPWLPYPLDKAYGGWCGKGDTDGYLFDFVYSAIGFGYDSHKNDFKVVRIWIRLYFYTGNPHPSSLPSSTSTSMYEVYSAREGEWRVGTADINFMTCQMNDFYDMTRRMSCYVNGNIHWLLDDYVLIFDCEREEFTTMELPEELDFSLQLLEYGGMLAAAVYSSTSDTNIMPTSVAHYIDLWVKEEHGWNKIYRIPDNTFQLELRECSLPLLKRFFPYGPYAWLKLLSRHDETFLRKVVRGHVYEEKLFLMDDPKAQSYNKDEMIHICSKVTPNDPIFRYSYMSGAFS